MECAVTMLLMRHLVGGDKRSTVAKQISLCFLARLSGTKRSKHRLLTKFSTGLLFYFSTRVTMQMQYWILDLQGSLIC
jgi:hypothetical protein